MSLELQLYMRHNIDNIVIIVLLDIILSFSRRTKHHATHLQVKQQ